MNEYKKIIDNWKDKNEMKLFFITNSGCDDSTHGLLQLHYAPFIRFATFVKNLNSNSTYSCMPRIYYEETDWDCFKKIEGTEHIADKDKFKFGEEYYTYADGHDEYTINYHAPVRVYYTEPLDDKTSDLEIGFKGDI